MMVMMEMTTTVMMNNIFTHSHIPAWFEERFVVFAFDLRYPLCTALAAMASLASWTIFLMRMKNECEIIGVVIC